MASKSVTTVGDRVKLKKDNLVGVVKFIGEIAGKKGVFYGVELDDAKGKNDGSVAKVKYFKCAAKKGLFVQQSGIAKTNTKGNTNPRVTVGDKVKCTAAKCNGTIRFIGTPYSVKESGVYYGIELEKPKGKNNGTVKGRYFFKCKDKCGTFLQKSGFSRAAGGAAKKAPAKKKEEPKKEEKKEDVEYKVGDKVVVKPTKKGQIKWIGEAKEFGAGVYYGIRLTENRGDCDGEWKEKRFFQCPEGFGVYVPLRMIIKKCDDDFDFMNEEEKYNEEARLKAEEYKKEREKLQSLREKFNEVDTDGNQTIDRAEFDKLAMDVFGCTKSEAEALFKEIDVNGSGEISFAEFDNWVEKLGGVEALENKMDDDAKDEEPAKEEAGDDEEPAADNEEADADADADADAKNEENNENNENNDNDDNDKDNDAEKADDAPNEAGDKEENDAEEE